MICIAVFFRDFYWFRERFVKMHSHRENYIEQFNVLENDIVGMSEDVIVAVQRALKAFTERDSVSAQKIIDDDAVINHKRWDIEERCISIIATQQPVASDLRELITLLNMIVELERMGDYAAGIAKIAMLHGDQPHIKPLLDIPRMAEKAVSMIKNGIKAFIERDIALAKSTWNQDNEIDGLYDQIFRELITFMIEDPKTITRATYVIWVAHNLERIADRVTNICERIVFLIKGKMEKMSLNEISDKKETNQAYS